MKTFRVPIIISLTVFFLFLIVSEERLYSQAVFEDVNFKGNELRQFQTAVNGRKDLTSNDLKPCKTAIIIGYTLIGFVVADGIFTTTHLNDPANEWGNVVYEKWPFLTAGALTAVGIPLSSILGGTTRRRFDINGNLGARITGYIIYGITAGTGFIAFYMLGTNNSIDPGFKYAVNGLCILTASLFIIDNTKTHHQAQNILNGSSILPVVGVAKDYTGLKCPTIGLRVIF